MKRKVGSATQWIERAKGWDDVWVGETSRSCPVSNILHAILSFRTSDNRVLHLRLASPSCHELLLLSVLIPIS